MTRLMLVALLSGVVAVGCGKKPEQKPAVEPQPEVTPARPTPVPVPVPGSLPPKTGLPAVDRQAASRDLKTLGLAYHNYHDASGRGPAKPADLLPFVEGNQKLIGNVESGYYVLAMNVNFSQLTNGTSNTILGYTWNTPTEGGVVLMADGSVKPMNKDDFASTFKAGQ